MKKRTSTPASIDTLLKTVCQISCGTAESESLITDHNLPSVSAQLSVANVKAIHQVSDNQFVSCWIELRGDVLVFSETNKERSSFKPRKISFAAKVDPPPVTLLSSTEMKHIAAKFASRFYMTVYGKDRRSCIWLAFNNEQELSQWSQVSA